MNTLKIVILSIVLVIASLIVGYKIGNGLGWTAGAQKYTQKLLSSNELSISTNDIFEKINNYRLANNKKGLEKTAGICNIAQKRAKSTMTDALNKWNQQTLGYDALVKDEPTMTTEEATSLCPECSFLKDKAMNDNYYTELSYQVLRPDLCVEVNKKSSLPCKGDEGFGVTEHFPDRILKQWIDNESLRKILLIDNYNVGCVESFGGGVVFSVGFKK